MELNEIRTLVENIEDYDLTAKEIYKLHLQSKIKLLEEIRKQLPLIPYMIDAINYVIKQIKLEIEELGQ